MSIQPAEFAKLAVVIGMALLVAERTEGRRDRDGRLRSTWSGCSLIAGMPAALILLQPDLGTMLVLSATVFGVLAVAGAARRWLVGCSSAARSPRRSPRSSQGVLKAYQVDRFLAFTNPDLDPRGAGYNTEQARIAVGNGGLFGQGLFDGSQTRSGFVPEQHTDFIFTVAGEELGLVGAGVLIALLGVVIWRALAIACQTDDLFGRVAAAGIACWFGFQAFQNIGMCLGIMPVTGVPLPVRVVRRQLDVRRHARRRPAPEHPPALDRLAPDPLHRRAARPRPLRSRDRSRSTPTSVSVRSVWTGPMALAGRRVHRGPVAPSDLLQDAVRRVVMTGHEGKSGAGLEKVWLADGRALVVQAGDPGVRPDPGRSPAGNVARECLLWRSGLFDRLPPGVTHALVDAWVEEDGTTRHRDARPRCGGADLGRPPVRGAARTG